MTTATAPATPAAPMTAAPPSREYLLGNSRAERERLMQQCALFAPEARWLLDQIGLAPGQRAIDVGCGPLGVLDLLAERVGPATPLVGLERDRRMLAMAREVTEERELANVTLIEADAVASGLPRAAFDLAHARLLLVNVPNPAEVLAEMAALVRPGGAVAVQEVDWLSWTCEPPHPAWDRLLAALEAVWNSRGLDVRIGRRLRGLLRAAGLTDVRCKFHLPVWQPGDLYQTLPLTFARLHWETIVAQGLLPEDELAELVEALEAHLNAPGTIVLFSLFCQAWGWKPLT